MTRNAVDLAEKNCKIDGHALTGGGVFDNHMPMLNPSAAKFRFG